MKDTCKNCGAWHGLHHWETQQCPRNGQEAPLGKLQEWDSTTYIEEVSEVDTLTAEIIVLKQALIEIRATTVTLGNSQSAWMAWRKCCEIAGKALEGMK
jgi:hypothetical protein